MSLRLRLTLWYTGFLAALLILVGAMVFSRVQTSVLSGIDRELQQKGDQIVRLVSLSTGSEVIIKPIGKIVTSFYEQGLFIQVRDDSRRVVLRSPNLSQTTIELPEPFYQQAMHGGAGFYNVSFNHPNDVRVYFAPIQVDGETVGIVQVGRVLTPTAEVLVQLSNNLMLLFAIALALAAGVGYWLTGVALQPINEATATALAITRTGNLKRRVPIHKQRSDEIGALINTFNEMLDRLEELFEKQRRFTGDISHELRSPLTTILGNLSLLRRAKNLPPEEREEMLDEMYSEAERMHRLISDLMLLSQADSGLSINRAPVELDTLLLEAYRMARRRAGDRLAIRLLHEDQAMVMGDADRLRQVLDNLINNAIRYTPAGGRIELSLHCTGDEAVITVADTGQGIAPEDLPHIFDRFYRADKARTRADGGTGLGLSIVKWIVDAHNGRIEVESAPGKGSAFRIHLPVIKPCQEASAADDSDA
jgi:heavy metal sensor kinase